VYVHCPAIDCVVLPAADAAMILDGLFNQGSLLLIQRTGGLGHPALRQLFFHGIRQLKALALPYPTALVAG
jgi:hypothetical protein